MNHQVGTVAGLKHHARRLDLDLGTSKHGEGSSLPDYNTVPANAQT
jgi:hypothetical protein